MITHSPTAPSPERGADAQASVPRGPADADAPGPDDLSLVDTPDAEAMARAIDWMVDRYAAQPSLEAAAAAAGLSPFHFQRLFKRWVGISPKRFCQYLTLGHAKRLLIEDASVLDAALDSGLSGPGRLHDLFVACEAMTPGEYKARGRALEVRWGFHQGPVGKALIATTPRGLCWLGFVVGGDEAAAVRVFEEEWAEARLIHDPSATAAAAARAFGVEPGSREAPLKLLLRGTNFQVKVWEALLRIPAGRLATYGAVAGAIGNPKASRAVGSAVGSNNISLIIPCHRVILGSGVIHNYRWAPERKRALIAWETARAAGEGDEAA